MRRTIIKKKISVASAGPSKAAYGVVGRSRGSRDEGTRGTLGRCEAVCVRLGFMRYVLMI